MRRDYFSITAAGVTADESGPPTLSIVYEGPTEELEDRLRRGHDQLDGDEVDVTYRLRDSLGEDSPMGVFAVSDRVTGEYVLELNGEADAIVSVTETAGNGGESEGNGRYRLVIETEDGRRMATYDKSTLLVYDENGELLRDRSLIPSGVEI